jgi:hypothetical protein
MPVALGVNEGVPRPAEIDKEEGSNGELEC